MKFRVIVKVNGKRYESNTVNNYHQAYGAVRELLDKGYDAWVEHVFPIK